jgi:tetratricopeptide (TPR) repeat protein
LLLERVGGNPLYVEEYVRLVAERDGAEVGVPDSVHAVIAARLDTLPPERKELLHAAAVVGKTFWAGALAAITRSSMESVLANLHELGRKELVRRVRTSSIEGDTEYLFWHVLVRDVAYEQMPRAERARQHVAAAEWIERIAGDRVTDHAEFLAHHYRTALEITRASGSGVEERLLDRAIDFARSAGDRACQLDMAAAARYYREALDLLRPGDKRRLALLLAWVDSSLKSSAFPFDVLEAELGEAIADFRVRGDDIATADTLRELAFLQIFTGAGADKRRALLEEAREILERHEPTRELALVYEQLTNYFSNVSDSLSALEIGPRALDLLERFDLRDETFIVRSRLLAARARVGDADALGEAVELVEVLRAQESGVGAYAQVIAINNLSAPLEMFGSLRAAIDSIEVAIELCDRRGLRAPGLWERANSLGGCYEIGDWERVLERATIVCSDAGAPQRARALALPSLARVQAARGQLGEAADANERSLALAREQEEGLAFAIASAALFAVGSGDAVLARAYLDEADSSPETVAIQLESLAEYARVSVFAGRLDFVRNLLTIVDRETPYFRRHATAAEAVVAEAEGRLDDAAAEYEEAARLWRDGGYVVEEAHARFGLARCQIGLGRTAAAEAPLREARDVYVSLGARTFLSQLDEFAPVRA